MLIVALAAVVLVLLLGVSAVLLDRTCAARAERTASDSLSASFGHSAAVRVAGRPFLTQALRGRYDEIQVSGGGLRIGRMSGATLDARLHNVHLPLRDLLGRGARELVCERVHGQLVIPFGELARVAKIPGLELTPVGERLMASAALPVPGLNQIARINGEAVWSVGGGGSVWLRIRGVSVAGIALPSIVLSQLLPTLTVPIPLPELPYGLRIDELRPTPAGLLVLGSAEAAVFRAPVGLTAEPGGSAADDPTEQDGRPVR